MILTHIVANDVLGRSFSLPLAENNTGFTLSDVEGLDPVKASVVTSSFAQLDGSQFQSASRENRNIVLTVQLEPYYGEKSVVELRSELYAFFMPKSEVLLKFYMDDQYAVYTTGVVESFETALFSRKPEVRISVICPNPNFIRSAPLVVPGTTTDQGDDMVINNPGTVDSGFVLTISPDRPIANFSVYNRHGGGLPKVFEFSGDVAAGNSVTLSTVPLSKYINVIANNIPSSALHMVAPTSVWMPLTPGENFFRVAIAGAAIPYQIEYTPLYGGL
jgi:hypothetical protein